VSGKIGLNQIPSCTSELYVLYPPNPCYAIHRLVCGTICGGEFNVTVPTALEEPLEFIRAPSVQCGITGICTVKSRRLSLITLNSHK
jgi:hypothetical protein